MGLTLEEVIIEYNQAFERSNLYTKIELKCWLNHSKSRVKNNHHPFTFHAYSHTMRNIDYIEQVEYDIIDCKELGGKDVVLEFLKVWPKNRKDLVNL